VTILYELIYHFLGISDWFHLVPSIEKQLISRAWTRNSGACPASV
jgi:hypothetical protein